MKFRSARKLRSVAISGLLVAGAALGMVTASGCLPSAASSHESLRKEQTHRDAGVASAGSSVLVADSAGKAAAKRGRIEHASGENFEELVLRSEAPVLVDFYADWCGPCRTLAPVLEEVARETPDARVVKINVDENPELAARYRVEGIPALKVFRNGKVTAERAGVANKAALKSLLL